MPHSVTSCEVAVIGAGPYGLSAAAHLRQAGLATRVFGEPMSFWRRHMPKGMLLRSPWRATHMSDPKGQLSLDAYADAHGTARDQPLPIEEFVAYGDWFRGRAAVDIESAAVRLVEASSSGFRLTLDDGETVSADRVVMATGLAHQEYRPPAFRDCPAALVTHSCEHSDFAAFRSRRVAVVGRGQSACESAVLLAEAGAEVEILCRGDIHWLGGSPATTATWHVAAHRLRELLAAPSAVGPFPLSWLAELPLMLQQLPSEWRDWFTKRCLKAGAAGWLKPRFTNIGCRIDRSIAGAHAFSDRIVVEFDDGTASFDHVVLGTGYHVDIGRLGILSPKLLEKIERDGGSPRLRSGFESSAPKLHFVGSSSVRSFGPLLRFVAGAGFAAREVTRAALAHSDRRLQNPTRPRSWPTSAAPKLSPPRG